NMSTRTCGSGQCNGVCAAGWGDCNNDKLLDGCETDLLTTSSRCGACNNVCSTSHVATPHCSAGTCDGVCDTGWADCNNNKLADGCEVNLTTDALHCGGCPNQCSNNHVPVPACSGSVCTGACETGWGDC